MQKDLFQGIWPAMLTPVKPNGEPDSRQIQKLVEALIREGADGLYLLGTTGMGPLLSERQRRSVCEWTVEAADKRVPIMAHVGSMTTQSSVALARDAAQAGADAISAVGPIYYQQNIDSVFAHYRSIGSVCALPFFPYHFAASSRLTFSPQQFSEKLLALPHVTGIKYTSLDLYEMGLLHGICGERVRIFSGADELFCHAALSGAVGAIGSYYNLWVRECKRVRKAFLKGNVNAARRFMPAFQHAISVTVHDMWGFFRKALAMKFDVDIGDTIAPLTSGKNVWRESEVSDLFELIENASTI